LRDINLESKIRAMEIIKIANLICERMHPGKGGRVFLR